MPLALTVFFCTPWPNHFNIVTNSEGQCLRQCSADYLPWVLLGLSLLLDHNILADLIGIGVGHVYFFLEDVYAKDEALGGLGGPRLLKTPNFMYVK